METIKKIPDEKLKHIAIIMDGNGRWATKKGLPREFGHKRGAETFRKIVEHCCRIGLKNLTAYAFSTENWKRPPKEVDAIMGLLSQYIGECEETIDKYDIHYKFIGELSKFPPDLQRKMKNIDELTRGRGLNLNIAFNYGGRDELVHAFRSLVQEGNRDITEDDVSAHLYTSYCGDPDLMIRTGGDKRISNFLLWQAAYAELYFTATLWPDFSEKELDAAIDDFYSRKRRYGGV